MVLIALHLSGHALWRRFQPNVGFRSQRHERPEVLSGPAPSGSKLDRAFHGVEEIGASPAFVHKDRIRAISTHPDEHRLREAQCERLRARRIAEINEVAGIQGSVRRTLEEC